MEQIVDWIGIGNVDGAMVIMVVSATLAICTYLYISTSNHK